MKFTSLIFLCHVGLVRNWKTLVESSSLLLISSKSQQVIKWIPLLLNSWKITAAHWLEITVAHKFKITAAHKLEITAACKVETTAACKVEEATPAHMVETTAGYNGETITPSWGKTSTQTLEGNCCSLWRGGLCCLWGGTAAFSVLKTESKIWLSFWGNHCSNERNIMSGLNQWKLLKPW